MAKHGLFQIYQNRYNSKKFLEVRRYADSHICVAQYIRTNDGCRVRQGQKARQRIGKKRLAELLTDYEEKGSWIL